MSDPLFDAFWARFATSAPPGEPHAPSRALAPSETLRALPADFVRWLTLRSALRIDPPRFSVSPAECARHGGDWLGLALARHHAMRALTDAYDNPLLARTVPFADSPDGLELALDLGEGAIIALDPARYDHGADAVRSVLAPDATRFVRALLDEHAPQPPHARAPSALTALEKRRPHS